MPCIPCKLGVVTFPSKAAARKELSDILYNYRLGERLRGEDGILLRAALRRHPNASAKIGCGVHSIYVDRSPKGGRCFYVLRIDGSSKYFSFIRCLNA